MKKLSIIFLLSIIISGCGKYDQGMASIRGFKTTCVNEVVYIQFTSGASVAYSPTGKILTCEESRNG